MLKSVFSPANLRVKHVILNKLMNNALFKNAFEKNDDLKLNPQRLHFTNITQHLTTF
jgi:hypothetical protein